ncbi:MAG: hypothetical protein HWN65_03460 [Candidatus Helarchaeota archaeon]|nr:hypothetical protein [Candidatus Helarchaeota archaeon]
MTLFHPKKAAGELDSSQNKKLYGIAAFLLVLILYNFTTFLCWLQNVPPSWTPVIPISPDQYYFYQLFFGIPIGLLSWTIFTLISYSFIKNRNMKLNFKEAMFILSFPFFIPMLPLMWTTETTLILFFPHLWASDPYLYLAPSIAATFEIYGYVYLILTTCWALFSATVYIKFLSKQSFRKSLAISSCAYFPALTLMILFIR